MTAAAPVLVLDGQTTQALACVRSLGRAGHPVYVASRSRWALAAWSRYCRGTYRLAGESRQSFAGLPAWAARRGVRVVLPLTERACLLCNETVAAWQARGLALGCGPLEMLERAFDKAVTLRYAAACGVPIPPTRFPTSQAAVVAAAEELGYPCVVKARFTATWIDGQLAADPGVAYVARPEDLLLAVQARRQGEHWPLLQSYVPGRGRGVFALCERGRAVAWFAHERLRDVRPSGSGSSLRRSVALDPRLQDAATRLLAAMDWHGPAMLEFRVDDASGAAWLIELNGRFWGSLQLAVDAGLDLPVLWTRMLLGEQPVPRQPAEYRAGVSLRWVWGDVLRFLHILFGPPPGYPGTYPRIAEGLRELLGRQPAGTRAETWDRRDPWPAVAEWLLGVSQLWQARREGARG